MSRPYKKLGDKLGNANNSNAQDPAGCTRAPASQWYVTQNDCKTGIGAGMACNPRYINDGAWNMYTPWARDSVACAGILPPGILGQVLTTPSLIDTQSPLQLSDLSVSMGENGHIAVFRFRIDGASKRQEVAFDQSNQVSTLFTPLQYSYAVQYGQGIMTMQINTMSGQVTLAFPLGNMAAQIEFQLTNVREPGQLPVNMAAAQLG